MVPPPRGRRLLHLDPRDVEGSGGQSVLLFCIIGCFKGQRLQVLGMRVGRSAWGLWADARGKTRCQSACGDVGVGQGCVEATESVETG